MRNIAPELRTFFDSKFPFSRPKDLLIPAAETCIGVTQDTRPDLVDLFRSTITRPWGEAWCMDFVQSCIAYVEASQGILSPLAASEGVLDTWHKSKVLCSVEIPEPGDIILWQVGDTAEGHCGIITSIDSIIYSTIEGNTSDSLEIDRMGRGVFAKKRAKGGTKTFKEVGFLRVFPNGISA